MRRQPSIQAQINRLTQPVTKAAILGWELRRKTTIEQYIDKDDLLRILEGLRGS